MTSRGTRSAAAAVAGILLVAWSTAQLVLAHRLAEAVHRHDLAGYHRFVDTYGIANVVPPSPMHARVWVVPAVASIVAAVALALVAAFLVRGGRRWWAAVVVAAPAANALRGWQDGRPLGAGWLQLGDHMTAWQVAGTAVDTILLAVLVVVLAITVPVSAGAHVGRSTALRAAVPMVVLTGWWFVRNPLPDQVHEIWLVQALAYVLAVAFLATARLPLALRAVAVLLVLPFCSVATAWAALDSYGVVTPLVHHDLFALATATYVVAVPALLRKARGRAAIPVAVTSGG